MTFETFDQSDQKTRPDPKRHFWKLVIVCGANKKISLVQEASSSVCVASEELGSTVTVRCPGKESISTCRQLGLKNIVSFMAILEKVCNQIQTSALQQGGEVFVKVTQRVPNQTCLAAVAVVLILPAASQHCSNRYQKLIFG